jgi:hypothetical protein
MHGYGQSVFGLTKLGKAGKYFAWFLWYCKVLVALSVLGGRYLFTNNHTFSSIFMYKKLKFYLYRVWYSIFSFKLVDCTFLMIVVHHICFVKDRGACDSGERNVNIHARFLKVWFSLISPWCQLPCFYQVWWVLNLRWIYTLTWI